MRSSILKSLKPDIIVEMLDMAVAFENWNKVLETAGVLYQCAQCIYEERVECQEKGGSKLYTHTERPLVYYMGWSHMMRGMAYQKQGRSIRRELVSGSMQHWGVWKEWMRQSYKLCRSSNVKLKSIAMHLRLKPGRLSCWKGT
ncbi:hypothetical protein [Paenibacillus amylolyticus]|uniref:hypothetical protein n=1 Tax=Paenibacillus TaxID=44249 RepID=UPI001F022368|nr:hypothetical protein [Paenibacillus amylolyticus]